MQAFIKDAREIIDKRLSEEKTLALLASPLERIIARTDCLAEVSA